VLNLRTNRMTGDQVCRRGREWGRGRERHGLRFTIDSSLISDEGAWPRLQASIAAPGPPVALACRRDRVERNVASVVGNRTTRCGSALFATRRPVADDLTASGKKLCVDSGLASLASSQSSEIQGGDGLTLLGP